MIHPVVKHFQLKHLMPLVLVTIFVIYDINYNYNKFKSLNKPGPLVENANSLNNDLMRQIKKSLVPVSDTYFQTPIAQILFNIFFSDSAWSYSISYKTIADFVSLLSVLLGIPMFILMLNDKSFNLKLACVLFQIKNVLDALDGPIARKDLDKLDSNQKNNYGRLIDGIGSTIPTFLFLFGAYIHIFKHTIYFNCYNEALPLTHASNRKPKLNCFYSILLKIFKLLSGETKRNDSNEIIKINNKALQINDANESDNQEHVHLKSLFFHLTLFTAYFVLAGIGWNRTLDKYKYLIEVSHQLQA